MKRNNWTLTVAAVIVLMLLAYTFCFTVQAGTVTVVKTFGRISSVKAVPGLCFKWPWPIQSAMAIDARERQLSVTGKEIPTGDEKNIIVTVVVAWQVSDAAKFVTKLGDEKSAENKLASRIEDARSRVIKTVNLSDIITTAPEQSANFGAFHERLLATVRQGLAEADYGIDVTRVWIPSIALPPSVTEKVFTRMVQERTRKSEKTVKEGKNEANLIRNQATLQQSKLLADARADAIATRGQGEAAAAEHYKVFKENPELADTLRQLDAMKEILQKRATVVLPSDAPLDALIPTKAPVPAETRK